MKRTFRIIIISILLVAAPLLMTAQTPPHPNGGNSPGAGNGPVGGGAPIGNGLAILVAMRAAYSARKFYQLHGKVSPLK
jgi:hypothetical protein